MDRAKLNAHRHRVDDVFVLARIRPGEVHPLSDPVQIPFRVVGSFQRATERILYAIDFGVASIDREQRQAEPDTVQLDQAAAERLVFMPQKWACTPKIGGRMLDFRERVEPVWPRPAVLCFLCLLHTLEAWSTTRCCALVRSLLA